MIGESISSLCINFSAAQKAQIAERAKADGMTRGELVRLAVAEYLEAVEEAT